MSNPRKWSLEKLKEVAVKYTEKCNFQKFDNPAYLSAYRQGILDQVCSHMKQNNHKKYTDKEIRFIAKQYTSRTFFQKSNKKAYTQAIAEGMGYLNEVCSHMISKKKIIKHTKESAMKDAVKYRTRREFCLKDAGSYLAAIKNGWADDICKHMTIISGSSAAERAILSNVREYYPDATQKYFFNKDKQFRQSRYQLDIYIPSLNKGIEYDGTYWHSIETLAKNKRISIEQASNYHSDKDAFFKSIGIEVLHIAEANWKAQEIWENRIVLGFLNILPYIPSNKKTDFFRRNTEEYIEELKSAYEQ